MTDKERKLAIKKLRTENDYLRAENFRLKKQLETLQTTIDNVRPIQLHPTVSTV